MWYASAASLIRRLTTSSKFGVFFREVDTSDDHTVYKGGGPVPDWCGTVAAA
jgi:hypothetical protein